MRLHNSVENTYGGDSDEFYELVIKKIVEETTGEKVLSKQFFSLQMHHHMKWDIIMEIK